MHAESGDRTRECLARLYTVEKHIDRLAALTGGVFGNGLPCDCTARNPSSIAEAGAVDAFAELAEDRTPVRRKTEDATPAVLETHGRDFRIAPVEGDLMALPGALDLRGAQAEVGRVVVDVPQEESIVGRAADSGAETLGRNEAVHGAAADRSAFLLRQRSREAC